MAGFVGLSGFYPTDDTNPNVSSNIPTHDFTEFYGTETLEASVAIGGGSLADSLPIDINSLAFDGLVALSFKNIFYYNITVTPSLIDLGNIVSNIVLPVQIFNAYFIDKTLVDASIIGDDGMSLDITLPYAFSPLEETSFDLLVSTDGPATINAALNLDFGDEQIVVPITGLRVVPYLYQPIEQIKETLTWQTAILTSYNGEEQRIRIRPLGPQQKISMTYHVRDENIVKSNLLISAWYPQIWGIPIWFEGGWLKGETISGSTISLDTTKSDFRVGGLVIVMEDNTKYEVIEIDSMDESNLYLTYPLADTYDSPYVLPMRTGIMEQGTGRDIYPNSSSLNRVNATFIVQDNIDIDSTGLIYPTYRTLPVLTQDQLRKDTISEGFINDFEINATSTGIISTIPKWNKTKITRSFSVRFLSSEFWDFRKFLHYCKGSLYPFFLPTFENDITITQTFANNAVLIVVENKDFDKYWTSSVYRYIRIELNNGAIRYSKITNVGPNANPLYEELSLGDALDFGYSVNPSDVKLVSLMCVARLASDDVSVTHFSHGISELTLSVVGIDYDG